MQLYISQIKILVIKQQIMWHIVTFNYILYNTFSQGLPPDGIKIISVLLHAHLTGRRITLRHIRDGKELPPIAQDNHIDFNYQHYRMLHEEVTVLPGDELITECVFDTAANETFVYVS